MSVFTALMVFSAVLPSGDSLAVSGLFRHDVLKIVTGSGVHEFSVEIAQTRVARTQGLQGRSRLSPGTGMLFDFRVDQMIVMWMKNTPVSLDMLFIAADGTVVNIVSGTEPFSLTPIRSDGPARAVLEVRAGTSGTLGVRKGDRIINDIFRTPG